MQDEFTEIMNHLSENARFALQKADYFSKRYNNGYMGTEHLLMGILAQDVSTAARLLSEEGINLNVIEKKLDRPASDVPGSQMAMMSLSEACVLTLRMAANFVKEQGLDLIGTEHVLYALLSQPNSRAAMLLSSEKVDLEALLDQIEELAAKQAETAKIKREK